MGSPIYHVSRFNYACHPDAIESERQQEAAAKAALAAAEAATAAEDAEEAAAAAQLEAEAAGTDGL